MKKPAAKSSKRPTTAKKPAALKLAAGLNFTSLVDAIRHVHAESAAAVNRTVNTTLTLRNWVIGAYIHHYELNGSDRARYGDGLLDVLADKLDETNVPNAGRRQLYLYLTLYRTYPQIVRTASAQSFLTLPGLQHAPPEIVRTVSAQLRPALPESRRAAKVRTLTEQSPTVRIRRSATAKSAGETIGEAASQWLTTIRETAPPGFATDGRLLIERLSFSHLEQLISIEEPLKRAFYEIECIRGNWSVRDLKRQIGSLYFERSGLSKDKEKLSRMVNEGIEAAEPKLAIRDPYIFEFLGLRAKDAVAESDLEAALIEHLREFLLELGHGFCLEAQQKSIVIGKTRGFVDLVFYHRILKCHVLVDLKIEPFTHENLGQLNTYVTWYREHIMAPGDNPPIGLLLCTNKDHALVRYATASVDNKLFVSKYAVELPSQKELEKFLHAKHLEMLGKS
ncbi:MAG: PDDEXK nuclease domain-containing protein [Prosthecobacter sp.]|uniref:PDDEXK nuclease domain-containing protein n=1 Tax=Prosthecobacter sp. TaxID=1965333 RepID=UPI0039001969